MKRNTLRLIILCVIIIIGLIIIISGISLYVGKSQNNTNEDNASNVDNDKVQDKIENNDDYNVTVPENLAANVEYKSTNEGTNFYYNVITDAETEKITLFIVRTEQSMNELIKEGVVDSVELIDEFNGTKYYSATGTGVPVDRVALQDQMLSSDTTTEEREKLVLILNQYNEVLKIIENKDELVKSFLKSN